MDGLIELTDFRFFLEREFHYSCETWVIEPLAREAGISISFDSRTAHKRLIVEK